jgi:RNA polymerase sigma factor (sigma-70 family)
MMNATDPPPNSRTDNDDTALIRRTLAGERNAFTALVERHRARVQNIARHALNNADDAQDVTQEVFVYAYQRLYELRDAARFSGWLRTLTLTRCADYRRRRGTRRLGEPLPVYDVASEEQNLTERIVLHEAVAMLSEAHRETFLLRYVGGWSEEDVSDLLQIPVNTVRSRLMAAKRRLRLDLDSLIPERLTMTTSLSEQTLTAGHANLLYAVYPDAKIVSVQKDPESWMPFAWRIGIELPTGDEKTVDFRHDLTPEYAAQITALARLGLPVPRLLSEPARIPDIGFVTLAEKAAGENLAQWAIAGTPHRVRIATDRAFEALDLLQGATEALINDSLVGPSLMRRTLVSEGERLMATGGPHIEDPWFRETLTKVRNAAADVQTPLVFSNYLHYFPNFLRIRPSDAAMDVPLGWPGDVRLGEGRLAEIVAPYGELRDPLLDLAMVWIYDCYPFVHTGFVERRLWQTDVSRREFGLRLALQSLKHIQRELPVARPPEGSAAYWDALHGWAEQGITWM